ncbi:tyrosine-type recombinase/integrase [Sphingomonas sp.]|uniref:tyrosine-type recombinase/integrase n=1 Tax=Sphingomonas sp. TaxID=28214 RepID=UPI0025E6750C|nr:tyrosine-type recombinase/integrase [Sphingomonas sp.]
MVAAARVALDQGRTPAKKRNAHRDLVMVATGFCTGLRVFELCKLELMHVDLVDRMIRVRLGKGAKDRDVPILEPLVPLLKEWIGERTSGYLFPGPKGRRLSERQFRDRLAAVAKRAGLLQRVYPHLMRHTFATSYLESNGEGSLRELQELLGHASLQTTEIYLHVKPARLKRGVDRLPFKL